jgi:hypothetical protein
MNTLFKALLVCICTCASAGAADTVNVSPTDQEMSPSEWRQRQLAAADKSDEIMRQANKQSGLLGKYLHMKANYDANHERAFQVIFGQYLSWFQTFIGDYDGAAASFSIAQPAQGDDAPSPLGGEYQARPAADVILEMTKDRKAVFFNEAHSAPITRTLTIELLTKLREQGFNYFAAETLYRTDKDMQQRGYPTPDSGFYVNEPLYGEMVRTALKLGFKIVPYDVENAGAGDARELAGAQNLYHVFKADPQAKLVVNAGFAHIQKSGKYLGGNSMAEFFQKMSGIDPLCVEQTMLVPHALADRNHPYYTAVVKSQSLTRPTVFVSGDKAWTLKPKQYDISVFFPSTSSSQQRPAWANLGGLRMKYSLNGELCRGQFPCLVEARYADEHDDAVAADRALLSVPQDSNALEHQVTVHEVPPSRLFLRPGKYRLTATDGSNRVLGASEIVIDASSQQLAERTVQDQRPPYGAVEHEATPGAPIK